MTEMEQKDHVVNLEATPRFPQPEIDEKSLVFKLTWRILPLISCCYFVCYLDRVNISNAHINFDKNLGLSENTYTLGVIIFYLTYIIFEIPSNMVLKKVSPPKWIARIMVTWGICSVCMMAVKNRVGFILCRIFLGMCEAGFYPGMVFYLSLWFTPQERAFRLALFYSGSAVAGIVGGAIAYGLFSIEGAGGLHGWQWLFLIEGIPSIIMGFIVWFTLPPNPNSVSWLDDNEKKAIQQRLAKFGQERTSHRISYSQIMLTFKDYRIWLLSFLNMCVLSQAYSIAYFLPAIVQDFGFNTADANGLTAPIWFAALLAILLNALHSDHQKERAWHIIIPATINTIFWILLGFSLLPVGITPSAHHNNSTQIAQPYYNLAYQYSTAVITVSCSYSVPVIVVIWITDMFKGGSQLAFGIAFVTALGNCGGFVGPLITGSVETATGSYAASAWIMSGFSFLVALVSLILWLLGKNLKNNFELELDSATVEEKTEDNKELTGWRNVVHKVFVGY